MRKSGKSEGLKNGEKCDILFEVLLTVFRRNAGGCVCFVCCFRVPDMCGVSSHTLRGMSWWYIIRLVK